MTKLLINCVLISVALRCSGYGVGLAIEYWTFNPSCCTFECELHLHTLVSVTKQYKWGPE